MDSYFDRFIDRVAQFIAPRAVVRGNVVVVLRREISDDGFIRPTFDVCLSRKWNFFQRLKLARGFTLDDVDDLIGILKDLKNVSHESISVWLY